MQIKYLEGWHSLNEGQSIIGLLTTWVALKCQQAFFLNRVAYVGSRYWAHLFAAVSDWLQMPNNRGSNSSALMLEQNC